MEQTPPHLSGSSESFAIASRTRSKRNVIRKEDNLLPSNNIAMVEDDAEDFPSLSEFRIMCDDLFYSSNKEGVVGGSTTLLNAPGIGFLRYAAELPLKLYNETNSRSFELVKVCKINVIGCVFYAATFKAKEGPSGEVLLFRGVVHIVGGTQPLYCEIKDDDEIKLQHTDSDYDGDLIGSRFRWLRDNDDGDVSPEAEFEELKARVARARLPSFWDRFLKK